MGRQPYLYQPVTHAPFNPKAYTHSLQAQQNSPRRPKPEGPLITFNRHPDSYDNLPYGKHVGAAMMSDGSKKRIIWARKIQLAWRVLQWIVAVGVLVCVVMVKGVPDTQGWILRLPPGFDIAVQGYAIWHLCRSPTHHPPNSAASYHAFALIMDIGFIPFYAFTGILSKTNRALAYGADGRWRTMLGTAQGDATILQVATLTAIVGAGLHAVTIIIGSYLIYMFRKIAELPPDMNPLEDNLTSRAKKQSKHKYKNSDMSTLIGEDKRFSEISARDSNRTLCEEDQLRMSQMSEKLMGVENNRASGVSFFQSRSSDSNSHQYGYSPHNPDTARHSWHVTQAQDQDPYRQSNDSNSGSDIGLSIYAPHKGNNDRASSPPKARKPRPLQLELDEHQPLPHQFGNSRTMSPMPNAPRITKRASATPSTPIPIYDEGAVESNWEVLSVSDVGNGGGSAGDFDPYRQRLPVNVNLHQDTAYSRVAQNEDADLGAARPTYLDIHDSNSPSQPLRMNPPTPEPTENHAGALPTASPLAKLSKGYSRDDKENDQQEQERTQTMLTTSSSVYSDLDTETNLTQSTAQSQGQGQGQGKGTSRFYTDLAAAMRGVRHYQPEFGTKGPKSVAGSVHTHLSESTAASSRVQPATQGDRRIKPSGGGGTIVRKPLKSFDESKEGRGMMGYTVAKASPSRVVSRSGVDVVDYAAQGDLGMGRRRDVSGKVAEEGRGGGMWRRISGRKVSR